MEIFIEMGLQVIEILTLIFGILGMTFSAMLMFSPNLTRNLSNILNRNINVDEKIRFLDKDIEISAFIYSHHIVLANHLQRVSKVQPPSRRPAMA